MNRLTFDASSAAVVLVDVQTALLPLIDRGGELVARAAFLLEIARLLEVPIFATEQNPSRMGGTVSPLAELLPKLPFAKMAFGVTGCPEFMAALAESGRKDVTLIGVETHICISQSALGLRELGYAVGIAEDAVGARSADRHLGALPRLRHSGIRVAHSEAIAYEWLGTAAHPKFRDALAIVKRN